MNYSAREEEWAVWMRAAVDGDAQAYHRFLSTVTPHLRAMARRRCDQFGAPASEAEDVVQEVLLTMHLKRGTWDTCSSHRSVDIDHRAQQADRQPETARAAYERADRRCH